MKTSIPKTIHYCWFGGNPLGDKELACINSWKKYLPEYEIKRWDERNYDCNSIRYTSEAYDAGKWAFVSDYARFDILYKFGGLYFDTDVEIIHPIDDIIAEGPFMGFESNPSAKKMGMVAPGLGMAALPGMPIYKEVLDSYEDDNFFNEDGSCGTVTVVSRMTDILVTHGLSESSGIQSVAGINIYPSDYFNPMDMLSEALTITENTRTIHHFAASWHSSRQQVEKKIRLFLCRIGLPGELSYNIAALIGTLRYLDFARVKRTIRKLRKSGRGK